jgi:hypothetical protein
VQFSPNPAKEYRAFGGTGRIPLPTRQMFRTAVWPDTGPKPRTNPTRTPPPGSNARRARDGWPRSRRSLIVVNCLGGQRHASAAPAGARAEQPYGGWFLGPARAAAPRHPVVVETVVAGRADTGAVQGAAGDRRRRRRPAGVDGGARHGAPGRRAGRHRHRDLVGGFPRPHHQPEVRRAPRAPLAGQDRTGAGLAV